ncbi:MAG: EAL domain-containing protein [Alphaproteobacteria bacterium]
MNILLVDHDAAPYKSVVKSITTVDTPVSLKHFSALDKSISWAQKNSFNLAIIDAAFISDTGMAEQILQHATDNDAIIVVVTDNPNLPDLPETIRGKVADIILKPFAETYLAARLSSLVMFSSVNCRMEKLHRMNQRFEKAFSSNGEGLFDWDLRNDNVYYSQQWLNMIGFNAETLTNKPLSWFNRVHPEDLELLRITIENYLEDKSETFHCQYRMRHMNGYYRWMIARGVSIKDSDGTPYRFVGAQADVTESKNLEERLAYEAFHDNLTGLVNRTLLFERINQLILQRKRDPEVKYTLLYLDLDFFKDINDNLGHEAGDDVLQTVSQRLRACCREQDTVARIGGDEFIVLMPGAQTKAEVQKLATRIIQDVGSPINLENKTANVGISIGIVTETDLYTNPEDVIRDADLALHHAKKNGRNRSELFATDMKQHQSTAFEIHSSLIKALDSGQMELHYQPIIDLHAGEIRGMEALIRWNHPKHGLIYPADFIPTAEEGGHITRLGQWVIEQVFDLYQRWHHTYPCVNDWMWAINVSPRQFENDGFIPMVRKAMSGAGVNPNLIEFEITESMLIQYPERLKRSLHDLKELGINIAIDDFGTGYSTLSTLHEFPIDCIKIARSFVTHIDQNMKSFHTVRLIQSLARNLNLRTIVEGIETPEEYICIKEIGCSLGQGFLFSKPLPEKEIEKLLDDGPKAFYDIRAIIEPYREKIRAPVV